MKKLHLGRICGRDGRWHKNSKFKLPNGFNHNDSNCLYFEHGLYNHRYRQPLFERLMPVTIISALITVFTINCTDQVFVRHRLWNKVITMFGNVFHTSASTIYGSCMPCVTTISGRPFRPLKGVSEYSKRPY